MIEICYCEKFRKVNGKWQPLTPGDLKEIICFQLKHINWTTCARCQVEEQISHD